MSHPASPDNGIPEWVNSLLTNQGGTTGINPVPTQGRGFVIY
jgi:hypothetical protein